MNYFPNNNLNKERHCGSAPDRDSSCQCFAPFSPVNAAPKVNVGRRANAGPRVNAAPAESVVPRGQG